MKRLAILLTLVFVAAISYAYDFEKDNLCYTILSRSEQTVSVEAGSTSISGNVVIPATVVYNGVTFTVTKIPSSGFASCLDIKTITLPRTLTYIGVYGLGWCHSLSTIILDNPGPTFSCGYDAFNYDWRAFSTVKIINCDVKEILEQGVGILTFLPEHSLYINGVKVVNFVVPDGTTKINDCLRNCNTIKTLTIPEGVTSIASNSLNTCTALETVRLPSTIESIGSYAFAGCAALRTIYCSATNPPSISSITFANGTYMFGTLHIPNNCTSDYENAVGWKEFATIEEVDNGGNPYKYCDVTLSVGFGGSIRVSGKIISATETLNLKAGEDLLMYFEPDDGYQLESVMINGSDVTNDVDNNSYTIPPIYEDLLVVVTFTKPQIYLTIKSADNGSIAQLVEKANPYTFIITPSEGWDIESVTFNGSDVTYELDGNEYTTPPITSDSELNIVYKQNDSDAAIKAVRSDSDVRVSASRGKLTVINSGLPTTLSVFSVAGSTVTSNPIGYGTSSIDLPDNNIYIVKVGNDTFKVAM